MAKDLPPAVVGLLTLWLSTILYSFNIVFYAACMWVLLKKRSRSESVPWILVFGITLQISLATTHIALMLTEGLNDLLNVKTTVTALAKAWTSIFGRYTKEQQVMFVFNALIGDLILIWRLYVVYVHNWYIIIFPTLMALGATACTAYTPLVIFTAPALGGHNLSFFALMNHMVTAGFVLSAATQLLVTSLICIKIWRVSSSFSRGRYMGIIWMLIESGSGLVITDLIFLAVWQSSLSGFSQLILGMLGQICVLVPLTIIVRVGLGLATTGSKNTGPSVGRPSRSGNGLPMWNQSGIRTATDTTIVVDGMGSKWKGDTSYGTVSR